MKLSDKMVARLTASTRGSWGERFDVLSEAGAGGMGVVYRAKDRDSGREVALKVIGGGGASTERFEREAAILERLDHPGIVDYVAHGTTEDGDPWLAMEWLEGVSLSQRLRDEPPLSMREVVSIARQAAGALAAAHAQGVVHRDLKPSNLFLVGGRAEVVKVLDFGVARVAPRDADAPLTETGQVLGTPGYMAPEQVRGARNVDGRADLFSLGCVLYRMVAGRHAFDGDDVLSGLAKLAVESPPALEEIAPDTPAPLRELVERLIAKDPADRPANASDVVSELTLVAERLDEEGSGDRAVPPRGGARPRRKVDVEAPTVPERPKRSLDEPAPASTLPSTTEWRAEVRKPGRKVVVIGAALGAIAVAIGLALAFTGTPVVTPATSSTPPDSASPPSPSAPPPPTMVTTPSPRDSRPEIQSAATRACRAWSSALARGQKTDGSFAMEPHRPSSGWDTGQQLTPLAAALPRCGGAGALPLRGGANALAALFHDGGWSGPGSYHLVEAGSIAWATLALAQTRAAAKDAAFTPADRTALESTLDLGKKSLLTFQRKDGSFRFAQSHDVPNEYMTVLGAWALAELAPSDGSLSDAKSRAAAYLRKSLTVPNDPMRTTIGLTEQATYVLLRLRETGDRAEGDEAILRSVATDIVGRCSLGPEPERACARPIADAGEVLLDVGKGEKGKIATFWHPWTTLTAALLATDPAITGDATLARDLDHVARWGAREFAAGISHLVAAPTYKLSEYLFAAAILSSR